MSLALAIMLHLDGPLNAAPAGHDTIVVTEGRAQPTVTRSFEHGSFPGSLRYSFSYERSGVDHLFTVVVDGKTHRITVPERAYPELDVSTKVVSRSGPRRRAITITIEFGDPVTDCPGAVGLRNRLDITAGETAMVRVSRYSRCILDLVPAGGTSVRTTDGG